MNEHTMSHSEQIMRLCRVPRSMAQILAVVGDLPSVRVAVYNLVRRGKLVNLSESRTSPGRFVVADESLRIEDDGDAVIIPPRRFDASALIAAWAGRHA